MNSDHLQMEYDQWAAQQAAQPLNSAAAQPLTAPGPNFAQRRRRLLAFVLIIIGSVWLFDNNDFMIVNVVARVWPAILVALGGWYIFGRSSRRNLLAVLGIGAILGATLLGTNPVSMAMNDDGFFDSPNVASADNFAPPPIMDGAIQEAILNCDANGNTVRIISSSLDETNALMTVNGNPALTPPTRGSSTNFDVRGYSDGDLNLNLDNDMTWGVSCTSNGGRLQADLSSVSLSFADFTINDGDALFTLSNSMRQPMVLTVNGGDVDITLPNDTPVRIDIDGNGGNLAFDEDHFSQLNSDTVVSRSGEDEQNPLRITIKSNGGSIELH